MKYEYLLFNIIIAGGPLLLSFDRRVNFFSRWPRVFKTIVLVAVPYLAWDILVNGRHWWFNPLYISGVRPLGLPLGEWLFFFTVPFACLFIWEVLNTYWPVTKGQRFRTMSWIVLLGLPAGIVLLATPKEYTALAFIAFGGTALLDRILNTGILANPQTYSFLGIALLLMLVFNGYLTARPVVLYDDQYQLNILLYTIPLEDLIYGISLLLYSLILYTKLGGTEK